MNDLSFTQRVLKQNFSMESFSEESLEDDTSLKEESDVAEKESKEIEGELDTIYQNYDDSEIHIEPEGRNVGAIQKIIEAGQKLEYEIGWHSQQMPSTEALDLSRVKELIHTFLETTKQLIIKLYENMDYYWDKFVLRLNNLIQSSHRIKEECQEKIGKVKSGESLTSERMTFRSIFFYNETPLNDFEKIHDRFNHLIEMTNGYFNHWTNNVVTTGIKVTSLLDSIHPKEIDSVLHECNVLTNNLFDGLDNKFTSTQEVMGGVTISLSLSEKLESDSPTATAVALMSQSFNVESKESPIEDKFKVKIFSLEEIQTLMDSIIQAAMKLKDELTENRLPRLSANTRRMVKGAVRKYSRMDVLLDETHYADKVNLTYRYGYAYGKWVRNPSMTLATLLVTISRGIHMLSREMLIEYK